jgi:hypothetical protein
MSEEIAETIGTIAYWRRRAEQAEAELADARARLSTVQVQLSRLEVWHAAGWISIHDLLPYVRGVAPGDTIRRAEEALDVSADGIDRTLFIARAAEILKGEGDEHE